MEFSFSLKENTSPQAGWERSSRSASFVFAVLTATEPCRGREIALDCLGKFNSKHQPLSNK